MAYDTITQIDRFTSDGATNKVVYVPSGVDRIIVENETQADAANNGYGFRYTWNRGSATDNTAFNTSMLKEYHPAGDQTMAIDKITNAIEFIDTSKKTPGAAVSVTGGTNVVQPVYTVGSTDALKDNFIVRISGSDQTNLNGLAFSVDVINGTTFKPKSALATAPGIIAGANGFYRLFAATKEAFDLYKPATRILANISKATAAVVTCLVDHSFQVGTKVKFNIPSGYGMTELNGEEGVVTAVTANTFTVDVDTSGYTTYTFPTYASTPFTYAEAHLVGDGKSSVSLLTPAKVVNQGYIAVVLPVGIALPGGNTDDVIRVISHKVAAINNI